MDLSILLKELNKLNLPKNKYAITSSGSLAMRKIREANDLDIIVSKDLWNKLSKKYSVSIESDFQVINIGVLQILGEGSDYTNPEVATPEIQIKDCDFIDGYPCVKLTYIREVKGRTRREKDLKDIQLIEAYLEG